MILLYIFGLPNYQIPIIADGEIGVRLPRGLLISFGNSGGVNIGFVLLKELVVWCYV
jgi:hypothetical protein